MSERVKDIIFFSRNPRVVSPVLHALDHIYVYPQNITLIQAPRNAPLQFKTFKSPCERPRDLIHFFFFFFLQDKNFTSGESSWFYSSWAEPLGFPQPYRVVALIISLLQVVHSFFSIIPNPNSLTSCKGDTHTHPYIHTHLEHWLSNFLSLLKANLK